MYLSVGTRLDITHAVNFLSQFNEVHRDIHWKAAKRVLRYLKETLDVGMTYRNTDDPPKMFADADWGGCNVDHRSYSGYIFMMSGATISWDSRKQRTIALSSTEAEYMALSKATKEALYMKKLLNSLGMNLQEVTLDIDMGAQKLATNPVFHAQTKHIDIRHHFVRDAVEKKMISIEHVSTNEMVADLLTKALPRVKHEKCVRLLGLTSP